MTPKERIDKRAKEMHKPILKEVKRLESELVMFRLWMNLARVNGIERADIAMEHQFNWKP